MRANKKSRTLPEKLDRRLQTSSISIGKSKTSAAASFHHRPRRRDSIPPSPQRHTTPLRQSPRFAMAAVADRSHLSAMDANTVDANAATEAPCKQPASHPSTKAPEAFVFACPGCGATLQAALQAEITSVQCDSCRDVFDVQMPPRDAPPIAPPPRAPPPAATGGAGAFTLKRQPSPVGTSNPVRRGRRRTRSRPAAQPARAARLHRHGARVLPDDMRAPSRTDRAGAAGRTAGPTPRTPRRPGLATPRRRAPDAPRGGPRCLPPTRTTPSSSA